VFFEKNGLGLLGVKGISRQGNFFTLDIFRSRIVWIFGFGGQQEQKKSSSIF
jgi:hypothetical protein